MRVDGFYPSRKISKRSNRYLAQTDLLPLFCVLLVLLVVVMVASAPANLCSRGVRADLPLAGHTVWLPKAMQENAIRIYVVRDESLYFGNSRVLLEGIRLEIVENLKGGSEKHVYVEVDSRVRYGFVKKVLDEIRDAQVENVSFLVETKSVVD